ncbi:MAG TPA: AAA family ATPase, partial [Planctomycetaceae bacterium]|nr:AAA family ATPase [Planctomycetaceae bacterium]
MGLFDRQESGNLEKAKPLAARMRPRSLDEFVGQSHFLGEGKLLRRILAADRIGSLIFYGSPGTGKTSLAELIAL